jgi:REP element-mobilizing transposase RayT
VRHRFYAHVVWTTQGREPRIDADLARFLCRFVRPIAGQERARILELGMVSTHVHALVRLHLMTDVVRLVQRLKGSSAAVANRERRLPPGRELRWAKGYSLQSVSPRAVPLVREYLRAQPKRHPKECIPGWEGDTPESDPIGDGESGGRTRVNSRFGRFR